MKPQNETYLLAPCGINCKVCYAHLRKKKQCPGCNAESDNKVHHCAVCSIKNCNELKSTDSHFCFSCKTFPCKRLKLLDKRYTLKYKWSLLDNLNQIKTMGIDSFWNKDIKGWTCSNCSHLISIHTGVCSNCGKARIYDQGLFQ